MSKMSRERTPPWVHDKYERSDTESVAASGKDDLVNRLDRLKNDPEVRHQLDKILKEAYEKDHGEVLDLDSDDVPRLLQRWGIPMSSAKRVGKS